MSQINSIIKDKPENRREERLKKRGIFLILSMKKKNSEYMKYNNILFWGLGV